MSDGRWRRWAAASFGAAAALASAAQAFAHPHAWIDIWSTVLFDEHGQATALEEVWLFDEYYTAFAVEGLDEDGDGAPDPAGLAALLRENMGNLQAYDYFTRVERDGAPVPFGPITEMSSRMQGDRLEMRFVVPFAAPLLEKERSFRYAIYDPTYYIEMLHAIEEGAVQLRGAPPGCETEVAAPEPDPDAVATAAMLDRTASGEDALGAQFAERVTVRCPAP